MSEHHSEYVVRVHHDEDGSLWAEVLGLPGCFASGDSLDELSEAVEEAVRLYLGGDVGADDRSGPQVKPRAGQLQVDEMRVRIPA